MQAAGLLLYNYRHHCQEAVLVNERYRLPGRCAVSTGVIPSPQTSGRPQTCGAAAHGVRVCLICTQTSISRQQASQMAPSTSLGGISEDKIDASR